jgi:SPX domain protein involved in polyphosphate accumulation
MSIRTIHQTFDTQGGAVNQRFEIKYLVDEMMAQQIIDYISTYMDPDPQGRHYPVTSLYLDNDRMSMYWSSEMGEQNRYKLRLRSYTDDESLQVFAEVKRRLNRVVLKTRVAIHSEQIGALLDGSGVTEDIIMETGSIKAFNDLRYFRGLHDSFRAMPSTTVRYDREAFVARDGDAMRITFDRNLRCLPSLEYSDDIWDARSFWHILPQVPVVLEVKFTDHYPHWVQKMIQRFGLQRTSMAKYVQCVKTLHGERINVSPMQEGMSI